MNTRESGQTLLELVIAIGVVALVMTGLVSAVTSSLRYGQNSRIRSQSVKFAQEGLELTRKLRDTVLWSDFLTKSGAISQSWCLDAAGTWTVDSGVGCPMSAGSVFRRSITFTWNDPVMDVSSVVSWGDHSPDSTVTLRTFYSQWK